MWGENMGNCKECKYAKPKKQYDYSPQSGKVYCEKSDAYVGENDSCGMYER